MEALYHAPAPVATPFSTSRRVAKRMADSTDGIVIPMSDTGQFNGFGVMSLADYVRMKYILPGSRGR